MKLEPGPYLPWGWEEDESGQLKSPAGDVLADS